MTTEVEEIRIPVKSAVEAAKRTAYYEQRGYSHPSEIKPNPPKAVLSAVSICEPSEQQIREIAKVTGCEGDLDRARARLIRDAESHLVRIVSMCPKIGESISKDLRDADAIRRAATQRIFEMQSKLDHLQNQIYEFGGLREQVASVKAQHEAAVAKLDSHEALTLADTELARLTAEVKHLPKTISDLNAKVDELRPQILALEKEIGASLPGVMAEMLRRTRPEECGPIVDLRGRKLIEGGYCDVK